MITRPLLAVAATNLDDIDYPVLATPKYDGIRCLKVDGEVVTRKFKQLPNVYVRELIKKICPDGVDGEIVCPGRTFNEVQSDVMSFDGEPKFEYHIFDYVSTTLYEAYRDRVDKLTKLFGANAPEFIKLVLPVLIHNKYELAQLEEKYINEGFEGVIVRDPAGKYKCGRSTLNEGILLKIKRFTDAEAEVLQLIEKEQNTNEQVKDEFGLSKRSHKKEGMVLANTLGAIAVRDIKSGVEFEIGTGFDDALRKEIWGNKDKYLGQIVKYKYQEAGLKEKPRFPVFLGFRNKLDMD